MGSILAIRGGAVGDFILTLPALALIREAFPDATLDVMGYRAVTRLVHQRHYAQRVWDIEYAKLAPFFARGTTLPGEWSERFASYDQVVSYLYDPDCIFADNLAKAGVRNLIAGSPQIQDGEHAALQLARPLQQLALFLDDPAARLFPTEEDLAAADTLLNSSPRRLILHPGSGGAHKLWPAACWKELLARLPELDGVEPIVVAGEADSHRVNELRDAIRKADARLLDGLDLTTLAAVLARASVFLGHDSGVSHIAAATGTPSVVLFGPTNPDVWAPHGSHVTVLRGSKDGFQGLDADRVIHTLAAKLQDD